MVIHSIVSLSDIFYNSGESEYGYTAETRPIQGGWLEISEQDGEKRIRRLISTNPALYLDKRYLPFTSIK